MRFCQLAQSSIAYVLLYRYVADIMQTSILILNSLKQLTSLVIFGG